MRSETIRTDRPETRLGVMNLLRFVPAIGESEYIAGYCLEPA